MQEQEYHLLTECKACGIQYVGETKTLLHISINGHQSDIKHNYPESPVAMHFNASAHLINDLLVRVTEQLWRDDAVHCKMRESWWIHSRRSVTPYGVNLDS